MQELELGGKRFVIRPWTLAEVGEIEERTGGTLLDIKGTISHITALLYVSIRGQHGVKRYSDAQALIPTMEVLRKVDEALREPLTQAIEERYNLHSALRAEPEGEV